MRVHAPPTALELKHSFACIREATLSHLIRNFIAFEDYPIAAQQQDHRRLSSVLCSKSSSHETLHATAKDHVSHLTYGWQNKAQRMRSRVCVVCTRKFRQKSLMLFYAAASLNIRDGKPNTVFLTDRNTYTSTFHNSSAAINLTDTIQLNQSSIRNFSMSQVSYVHTIKIPHSNRKRLLQIAATSLSSPMKHTAANMTLSTSRT